MLDTQSSTDLAVNPLCVGLAVAAGCCLTLAAVVVAYPAQRAMKLEVEQSQTSKICSVLANLIFVGAGISLNIVAVGYGAVAIVTPCSTGANLLCNLVLQPLLGIAHYSQNAIIGTFVLASAVTMLVEVGPTDIDPNASVLALIMNPAAIIFLFSVILAMSLSICAVAKSWVSTNIYLVFLYCLIGGSSTIINTALTKLVQMDVPLGVRIPMVMMYLVLACIGLASDVKANSTLEDPSLFIPVGAGTNLVLTCLAGLFVWGDANRLTFRLCYAMVYVLIVLGSFLVSSIDLIGIANHSIAEVHVNRVRTFTQVNSIPNCSVSEAQPRGARGRKLSSFFEGIDETLEKITGTETPLASYADANLYYAVPRGGARAMSRILSLNLGGNADDALRMRLRSAISVSEIDEDDLVDLCISLLQDPGSPGILRSPALWRWLNDHLGSDGMARSASQPDDTDRKRMSLEVPFLRPRAPTIP